LDPKILSVFAAHTKSLILAIFMVWVRTLCSCLFQQSHKIEYFIPRIGPTGFFLKRIFPCKLKKVLNLKHIFLS